MANLERTEKIYSLLKEYKGKNSYIVYLKNGVFAYKNIVLNDLQMDFVENNYNLEPKYLHKAVKLADWWGEQTREKLNFDFVPKILVITWYLGETKNMYFFYAIYRKSQEKAIFTIVPKNAILTDFLSSNFNDTDIDFSVYNSNKSGRVLKSYQEEAVKFLVSREKCILADEQGLGKCQDVNTIIPTPEGYKKMGDLKVSDEVFSSDGLPHKIIGVYPQGEKEIYEIEFTDGTKTNCGQEHLWIAKKNTWKDFKVISTQDLIDEGIKDKDNHYKFKIPYTESLICLPKNHEIDSYSYAKSLKSDEISDEYKFDSAENRVNLLKGLMDVNGHVDKKGKNITYVTSSYYLAFEVQELIESLGGIAQMKMKNNKYCLNINVLFCPFEEEEKKKRYFQYNKCRKLPSKCIKSLKYLHKAEAVCIKVDSPDESYLTNDFIVTHNTTCATVAALAGNYKHILVICPASVKETWKKELSIYVNEDEITIVSGSKWKDNKFTIINYDILDNFYEVPTEIRKFKEKDVDENGKIIEKWVEKEVISRKKEVINAAMEKSQLFQSEFDLIIVDEAHKLSNTSAERYKIVLDLIKRSNPKGVFCITGTPITNNPYNFYNVLRLIDAPIVKNWEEYVKKYCDGKKIFVKGERQKWTSIFLRNVHKNSWYDLTYGEKSELNGYLDKNAKSIWLHNGATNLDELQERVKSYYLRREKSDFKNIVKKEVKLLHYELTPFERRQYDKVWEKYKAKKSSESEEKTEESIESTKQITEGIILRQWLANKMVKRTVKLAKKHIKEGEKVIIMCSFDKELYSLQKIFGDECVIYNGKMLPKQKEKAQEEFMKNPDKKVFIGNLIAAGVGITLTAANVCIFNSFSFVPGDNLQAQDRIHRLNQDKDCFVYYQVFSDTYYEEMFNLVMGKKEVIDNVIIKEKNK